MPSLLDKNEADSRSKSWIKSFVDAYHINITDFQPSNIDKYATFAEFFICHHSPGLRPISKSDDPTKAVVVADSQVVIFDSIAEIKTL